jgi:signal transduction histidine kinase
VSKIFQAASAEKGLGFFALDLKSRTIVWEAETARSLGADAERARAALASSLASGLRSYILREIAAGSGEQFRCLAPLQGEVMEVVIMPPAKGAEARREGFYAPLALREPMDTLKKYFLSNIANKLRSLLNSVIIASDVLATVDRDAIMKHQKFLNLMAEDAREVNTLLNRLGETINYAIPGAAAAAEPIEVPQLLEAIHANLHYLAEDTSIALTFAVPGSMPPLKGDPIHFLLIFFLAVHYALSRTDPLGEILITARERAEWDVEVYFANRDIPSDVAVSPDAHGLAPMRPAGWSDGSELQLIDSLLGLRGTSLTLLGNGKDLGLLRLPLPRD